MIAQIDARIIIGAVSGCYLAIIAVYTWVSRTKVNHKLCDTVQEYNKEEHQHIRDWIEDAEGRAEKRHTELKSDLKEVKELIRNNGQSTPRIQT